MGGGKGGGGNDAGPMLEYGEKALGLQKEIYDQTRADAQPWYQAGTGAVNQLSKLMGLSGQQSSPANRDLLLAQNRDKFTTQSTAPSGGSKFVSPTGQVLDFGNDQAITQYVGTKNFGDPSRNNDALRLFKNGDARSLQTLKEWGFNPLDTATSTNSLDEAGLNSYVDSLIAQGQQDASDPAYGSLTKSFTMDDYQADPGYQFRLQEGNKALERKLNAAGKTYSPEAAKALMSYGQQLGSEEYGNSRGRFIEDQNNLFNRLASLSGFGQTASGQMAGAGQNYGNQGSELYTGMGNSITAANIAKANQGSSMFNTLLGAGAQLGGSYLMRGM